MNISNPNLIPCIFVSIGQQDFSPIGKVDSAQSVQEISIKRLVVGPLDLLLHSSAVHRILKMVACAMDHEYGPYYTLKPGNCYAAVD